MHVQVSRVLNRKLLACFQCLQLCIQVSYQIHALSLECASEKPRSEEPCRLNTLPYLSYQQESERPCL